MSDKLVENLEKQLEIATDKLVKAERKNQRKDAKIQSLAKILEHNENVECDLLERMEQKLEELSRELANKDHAIDELIRRLNQKPIS